jgi:hypothetical protein
LALFVGQRLRLVETQGIKLMGLASKTTAAIFQSTAQFSCAGSSRRIALAEQYPDQCSKTVMVRHSRLTVTVSTQI